MDSKIKDITEKLSRLEGLAGKNFVRNLIHAHKRDAHTQMQVQNRQQTTESRG